MTDAMRMRVPAPQRAAGVTTEFVVDGTPGRLVTAAGPDGQLAHVDLSVGKHGSTLAGLTDALCTALTAGLRAGAPLSDFVDELRHTRCAPAGVTGDPEVPHATSLGDYLAQRLRQDYEGAAERP